MTGWDPDLYLRFADERARPFRELVGRVPAERPRDVADLGCGPGTLTASLRIRWPEARITGVEASAEMAARAQAVATRPQLVFEHADLRTWRPSGQLDVVLANASLHWVPDHLELLERFTGWLRPGGVLAFQVPGNYAAPSHRLLAELVASPRWAPRLGDTSPGGASHDPEAYLRRLHDLGLSVDCWETTYLHVLHGEDAVLDWVRGSTLRPVLGSLAEADTASFIDEYAAALRAAYAPDAAGRVVFPFRRIFAVATRPG